MINELKADSTARALLGRGIPCYLSDMTAYSPDATDWRILDVLDSLRERDRSVGIVSHVADLRRRIHAQLEVVKGRSGSVLRQRGGG